MSYREAANAWAYRRAALNAHFRPNPGPVTGPSEIVVHGGAFTRLQSGDLLVHEPWSMTETRAVIDTPSMGELYPGADRARTHLDHDIDFTTDARLEPIVVEGFGGSDVTPPEPDFPTTRTFPEPVRWRARPCGHEVRPVLVDGARRLHVL